MHLNKNKNIVWAKHQSALGFQGYEDSTVQRDTAFGLCCVELSRQSDWLDLFAFLRYTHCLSNTSTKALFALSLATLLYHLALWPLQTSTEQLL